MHRHIATVPLCSTQQLPYSCSRRRDALRPIDLTVPRRTESPKTCGSQYPERARRSLGIRQVEVRAGLIGEADLPDVRDNPHDFNFTAPEALDEQMRAERARNSPQEPL